MEHATAKMASTKVIVQIFCFSANADGHARLCSINFERPLRSRQFEMLTEYNVPLTVHQEQELHARNRHFIEGVFTAATHHFPCLKVTLRLLFAACPSRLKNT
ncbi:MAG: hypothetical protein Q7U78_11140 [Gallionella sp.]|nr:hypothetical protein [Gallionella sp.]